MTIEFSGMDRVQLVKQHRALLLEQADKQIKERAWGHWIGDSLRLVRVYTGEDVRVVDWLSGAVASAEKRRRDLTNSLSEIHSRIELCERLLRGKERDMKLSDLSLAQAEIDGEATNDPQV